MTKQTEALKLALEALYRTESKLGGIAWEREAEAIIAIHEALALVNKVDQEESSGTERPAIPNVITCPFCSGKHIPGWLHDLNMDRGAYGEQPAIKFTDKMSIDVPDQHLFQKPAIKQDLTPEQPAQPQQEPVAWRVKVETKLRDGSVDFGYQLRNERLSKYDEPLYTTPPAQRTWVGLTDVEIASACKKHGGAEWWWRDIEEYGRAIEAKLREKNSD